MSGHIRIVGPRDRAHLPASTLTINTTSHSLDKWTTQLSPFHLGPCVVTGGRTARLMENGWQFSKTYPNDLDADGNPSARYWTWAEAGWAARTPIRYPRGKGAKPAYLWWNGEKLDYVSGRLKVYWSMYRDAVASTDAFARLQHFVDDGQDLALFDFDGYDYQAAGKTLADVLVDPERPMGHAFVLKAMLLYGSDVTPELVLEPPIDSDPKPPEESTRSRVQQVLF